MIKVKAIKSRDRKKKTLLTLVKSRVRKILRQKKIKNNPEKNKMTFKNKRRSKFNLNIKILSIVLCINLKLNKKINNLKLMRLDLKKIYKLSQKSKKRQNVRIDLRTNKTMKMFRKT